MNAKYVCSDTARFTPKGKESSIELLWGDRVEVQSEDSHTVTGRARDVLGTIDKNALGDTPLLEIYVIDVGQGDAMLVHTPDDRHLLIDGGLKRAEQMTRRSAADFVDWKFVKDYGRDEIHLDAMIASHCDADHFGGLWDLLDPLETTELDCKKVSVDRFYHAGISWWKKGEGRTLGRIQDHCLVDLLEGKTAVRNALRNGNEPQLAGDWAKFLQCVLNRNPEIRRVSDHTRILPDFDINDPNVKRLKINILAPIEQKYNGIVGLPAFGSDSQNTNGNSIVLRLDYGKARILLTGDLNAAAQKMLLNRYQGTDELACDVAKACHHGSDDCCFDFLKKMEPSATIISSGDNESYAHPRPSIVAASGLAGHFSMVDDKIQTPLVYSTEIARSVRVTEPTEISEHNYKTPYGTVDVTLKPRDNPDIAFKSSDGHVLHRTMKDVKLVSGIVYGLVNVRTDGNKILCATLNEKKFQWDVKTFQSRF